MSMKRNPMRPRFSSRKKVWISPRRFGKSSTAVIGVSAVPIATAIKVEPIKNFKFQRCKVEKFRNLDYN